ncbi:MAG: hypothetical protein DRN04_12080 [Thermoprotei archaeon]|nr:MAG: hypothetical protein DRN04_12080 [Thermoprotei archaeon]
MPQQALVIAPIVSLIIALILSIVLRDRKCNIAVSLLSAIASLLMIWIGLSVFLTNKPLSYSVILYRVEGLTLGLNRLIFVVDHLSALFNIALGILGFAVSIYAIKYMDLYVGHESLRFFGVNYSSFLLMMYLVITAYDIVWFIVFWELMTVTSQFLVSFEKERAVARAAGYKYFFMAKAGSELIIVFILIVIIYLTRFNTSFDAIRYTLSLLARAYPGVTALLFVILFIGLGVKAAIYPLHSWLPDAHSEAPSNISALLSGIMVKMAVYMMARSFYWFAPSLIYVALIKPIIEVL